MSAQRDIVVEARGVARVYHADSPQPIVALRNATAAFRRGEFVALMGRSGSGKSTFLHQLALLDTPTRGTVLFAGRDVAQLSRAQRAALRLQSIGYIFQDYALLPELTLYENIALPLIVAGTPDDARVREIIARVGLEGREGNLPAELSGGEQQRVSIARAVVNNPAVLFADEPTANLDSASARQVLTLLRELADAGQTIIMVTHEEDDQRYVDRVIRMRDGVLTEGSARE